jgi:hypothetical protein
LRQPDVLRQPVALATTFFKRARPQTAPVFLFKCSLQLESEFTFKYIDHTLNHGGAIMSEKDKKKLIQDMKAYAKKVSSSNEEAKKFLFKTGMYTRSGNLKSAYK